MYYSAVDDITTVQTVRRPRFIQADGVSIINSLESSGILIHKTFIGFTAIQ